MPWKELGLACPSKSRRGAGCGGGAATCHEGGGLYPDVHGEVADHLADLGKGVVGEPDLLLAVADPHQAARDGCQICLSVTPQTSPMAECRLCPESTVLERVSDPRAFCPRIESAPKNEGRPESWRLVPSPPWWLALYETRALQPGVRRSFPTPGCRNFPQLSGRRRTCSSSRHCQNCGQGRHSYNVLGQKSRLFRMR